MLNSLFLIGSFGTTEMLLILFVIILLFGAKRIPELFRGMGQGVREFKDATKQPEQPQYRDQPAAPSPPPYQQQGYAPQGGASQPGYAQPTPPVFNPNDPNNQPRQ
ncbi:twin-arginine translocase TatA/TatE family subunit [Hymenobacter sp. BT664]|uniref:Sec-independent protein translocase protein TatA n=1 Tax=Hymenobacter montanus TaxID=2771359 RepID=A0A927GKZ6_9BACT|nr:twin-arginine translocase TatA/TatE family subunit [Hymenobacter montanus]MBD2770082.1 twin-arginine translocase TatA/TatE family subunit [Hymenobacter montanus]